MSGFLLAPAEEAGLEGGAAPAPAKRGRGRPRKTPVENLVFASNSVAMKSLQTGSDDCDVAKLAAQLYGEKMQKKPRGKNARATGKTPVAVNAPKKKKQKKLDVRGDDDFGSQSDIGLEDDSDGGLDDSFRTCGGLELQQSERDGATDVEDEQDGGATVFGELMGATQLPPSVSAASGSSSSSRATAGAAAAQDPRSFQQKLTKALQQIHTKHELKLEEARRAKKKSGAARRKTKKGGGSTDSSDDSSDEDLSTTPPEYKDEKWTVDTIMSSLEETKVSDMKTAPVPLPGTSPSLKTLAIHITDERTRHKGKRYVVQEIALLFFCCGA